MEKKVQLIIGSIIVVLALFGSLVLEWQFDKDFISLKKDGKIIVEERWHVEAERTYSIIKYSYQRDSCLRKGGEIREYENSRPRCYYPDDFYEMLKRSLIRTNIDTLETENEIEVTKKSPFYMYGTRGAYAGYVTEEFLFNKNIETEEEFPESYNVVWEPRDTRNYKLVWRVEELNDLNLDVGEYQECNYIFGDIKIDLGSDCEKLDKAVVKDNERIWFYFKPVRGVQNFDLKLVDPQEPVSDKFDLIKDCWNETKERWVPEIKEVFIPCYPLNITNGDCEKNYYVNKTTGAYEFYKEEICEEIGVKVGDKEYLYEQINLNCLRTDNILCCWDTRDGGSSMPVLNAREPEDRIEIKEGSGETGFCLDLNDNLKELSYRSDWGNLELKENEIK